MTDPLVGRRVTLRFYAPGEGDLALAAGTVFSRVVKGPKAQFHDGFVVRLEELVGIGDFECDEVYVVPSGRYPFVPGKDVMQELLEKSVHVAVSWKGPGGEWVSWGERGTFAEVSIAPDGSSASRGVRQQSQGATLTTPTPASLQDLATQVAEFGPLQGARNYLAQNDAFDQFRCQEQGICYQTGGEVFGLIAGPGRALNLTHTAPIAADQVRHFTAHVLLGYYWGNGAAALEWSYPVLVDSFRSVVRCSERRSPLGNEAQEVRA